MYSHTASTLYFSWADMGTIGEFCALVPMTVIRDGLTEHQNVANAYLEQMPLCSFAAQVPELP